MSFTRWLSNLRLQTRRVGRISNPSHRQAARTTRRFRPALELLEDRLVPSAVVDSLYVGDGGGNFGYSTIKQFDVATGAYEGTFVAPYVTSLFGARGLIFNGNHDLLVSNQTNANYNAIGNIQRYSGFGDPLKPFEPNYFGGPFSGPPNFHAPYDPRGLCQGPDGSVFVADVGDLGNLYGSGLDRPGKLTQYDANGQWIRDLAPPTSDPYAFSNDNAPRGVVIGPDGDLYVSVMRYNHNTPLGQTNNGLGGEVMRFDPVSGAFLGDFVQGDPTNDLNRPEGLVFGPDGNLYITSFANLDDPNGDSDKILKLDGITGQYLGKIDLDQAGQPRTFAQAILFGPDGKLFVSIENTGEIRKYDASLGAFTQDPYNPGTYQSFVPAHADGGPISEAWYMTFDNTDPSTMAYKLPNLVLDARRLDLGTTTYGGASLEGAFTLPNDGQHNNFQVTAPAGFKISTDGLTWSSTLTATSGTAIDVETLPGADAGIVSGAVHVSSNGDNAIVIVRGKVNRATLTITPTPGQSMVYGTDFDHFPNLTYTADGFVNNDETKGLLSGSLYTDAFDYGTVGNYDYYTWDLSAGSNYQLVLAPDSSTFAITPAPLTITPDANQSMVYGSSVPSLTYSATGFVGYDIYYPPEWILSGNLGTDATSASSVGAYAFNTGTLTADNYTISVVVGSPTFAVTPAKLGVIADPQTKTYGSPDPALTYSAYGFQAGDSAATVLTGTLVRDSGETASGGPYAINQGKLTANPNYTIAYIGNALAITPTTLTVTADPETKVYGNADPALTYSVIGLQFRDKASGVLTGNLKRAPGETVPGGPYAITQGSLDLNAVAGATSNYTLAFRGNQLAITPATLSIKPTASQSKLYGGPVPKLSYTASGFVNGDPASILSGALGTTATAASPVGNYAFTTDALSAGSNYSVVLVSKAPTFAVTPATLTVTAKDTSRYYGIANPAFSYNLQRFLNNDSSSVVSGTPTLTSPAMAASAPGTYAITVDVSPLSAANYTFKAVNGKLTVNPAPLAATVVNFSATAGAPFSGSVATFINADPFGGAPSYTATITWGDGSTSAGVISGTGNTLTVTGAHTYADPVNEAVSVQISHKLGFTTTATLSDKAIVTSLGQGVTKGQTGGVGFWNSKNGQALISSFNGGSSSTALANWLAATFVNLYGASADGNNLIGKTNAQVAAFFQTQFNLGGNQVQALTLSTALNVYATTSTLGGNAGTAYGFAVSATGLGARSFNAGKDGGAFGVANNATLNVYELLLAVNKKAVKGVVYNGDTWLQAEAADLFNALNKAGSI
ncbi:MAG: MBG domain-containing protein [Gemmataceae bacterium]